MLAPGTADAVMAGFEQEWAQLRDASRSRRHAIAVQALQRGETKGLARGGGFAGDLAHLPDDQIDAACAFADAGEDETACELLRRALTHLDDQEAWIAGRHPLDDVGDTDCGSLRALIAERRARCRALLDDAAARTAFAERTWARRGADRRAVRACVERTAASLLEADAPDHAALSALEARWVQFAGGRPWLDVDASQLPLLGRLWRAQHEHPYGVQPLDGLAAVHAGVMEMCSRREHGDLRPVSSRPVADDDTLGARLSELLAPHPDARGARLRVSRSVFTDAIERWHDTPQFAGIEVRCMPDRRSSAAHPPTLVTVVCVLEGTHEGAPQRLELALPHESTRARTTNGILASVGAASFREWGHDVRIVEEEWSGHVDDGHTILTPHTAPSVPFDLRSLAVVPRCAHEECRWRQSDIFSNRLQLHCPACGRILANEPVHRVRELSEHARGDYVKRERFWARLEGRDDDCDGILGAASPAAVWEALRGRDGTVPSDPQAYLAARRAARRVVRVAGDAEQVFARRR